MAGSICGYTNHQVAAQMKRASLLATLCVLNLSPWNSLPAGTPEPLLRMENGANAILVDKERHLLGLYRWDHGSPVLVKSYQATTGKGVGDKRREGDLKTPEGVYFFTRFIDGSSLPAEYGIGAAVMDYPNPFDQLEGKNGDGIWLHATNEPNRISEPYNTRGCVVVRNDHFIELRKAVVLRYTPIIVGKRIDEITNDEVQRRRSELEEFIERWRSAWMHGDADAYLNLYSDHFHGRGMTFKQFMAHKRSVFAHSTNIRVAFSDMQIYRLDSRTVVHFFQDFNSSLMSNAGYKTLHLWRLGGTWKIIGEEWEPLKSFQAYPVIMARAHPPVLIPSAPAVVLPAAVTMVTSLFGTDTRMVRISALRASELRPGSLGVDFELHNNVMDGGRLVGHLSVLVNLGVGGQLRQIVYPQMNLSNNLMPSDLFKNGEYYAIRYFKIVHANFSLPQGIGLTPLNVKVCVFDHSGNPLLIKDFPLSGERSLSGGDTASANLVWKTKS